MLGRFSVGVYPGAKFGLLTVIERLPKEVKRSRVSYRVLCSCECGGKSTPEISNLTSGAAKSCGCLKRATGAKNAKNRVRDGQGYGRIKEGIVFGRLTVICRIADRNGRAVALCSCSCGKETETMIDGLLNGCIQSCGCLAREKVIQRNKESAKWGSFSTEHVHTYRSWQGMLARCHNKNHSNYQQYGAVGVVVCEFLRESPLNLIEIIGLKKRKQLTIDRFPIHNGNYTCGQCKECKTKGWAKNIRWASRKKQSENRGDFNVHLTAFGKTQLLSQWQEETGIDARRIMTRVRREKWSVEKALSTPDSKGNCYHAK